MLETKQKSFISDNIYDFLTGDGNIESELFEKVIEDTVKEDINIVGFDTYRFETEEQAAKFRANSNLTTS